MAFPSDLHDPLAMNTSRQVRVLLSKISPSSPYATELLNTSSHRELLTTLSRLLAVPELTLSVAIAFRPLLLVLCAEWLHTTGNEEEKLAALCLLIQPHEELFP
jgi:midasin